MDLLPAANFAHAKQSCYRCGKASPVVDLDVAIEGEGALCLCDSCVFDAAQTAGFVIRRPKVQK